MKEDSTLNQNLPFLCGHATSQSRRSGFREECGRCGSFWDIDSAYASFTYDGAYPEKRGHFDSILGKDKVRSTRRWLAKSGLSTDGRVIFEVGFGGGFVLADLAETSLASFGVEAVPENIAHAERLGLPRERLFLPNELPERLPLPVHLWLFSDSFEHLEDPAKVTAWIKANSAPDARIVIVAPRADSWSRRLLGRFWPHKVRDHKFHWSRQGLVTFMGRHGFEVESEFYPSKQVSLSTCVSHLAHMLGRDAGGLNFPGARFGLPFNVGEMGLTFSTVRPA